MANRSCFTTGGSSARYLADPFAAASGIDSMIVAGHYGGLTTVPTLQFSWQEHDPRSVSAAGAYPPLTLSITGR